MHGIQSDILIGVEPILPCSDRIKAVGDPAKRRGNVSVRGIRSKLRARLGHRRLDEPCFVKPFIDVILRRPVGRSHGPLGRRLVEVRLVAQLPVRKLSTAQCFASQRHGGKKAVETLAPVLAQIEPVNELGVRPCRVAIEVRAADVQDAWVVGRDTRDDRTIRRRFQRGVVESIVPARRLDVAQVLHEQYILCVASHANVRLTALDICEIIEKLVGEIVGT